GHPAQGHHREQISEPSVAHHGFHCPAFDHPIFSRTLPPRAARGLLLGRSANITPPLGDILMRAMVPPFRSPLARLSAAFLLLAALLSAQKKPVTLESLQEGGMRGFAGQFAPGHVWRPQGGSFVWIEASKLNEWSTDSTAAKELFSIEPLEKQAVPVARPQASSWENRRVQEERIQWSADGKRLLLIVRGDLFLWDSATNKTEQLTATPVAERDPKLSPDGTKVAFRRGSELYVLDIAHKDGGLIDASLRKETRLTFDGA